MTSPRKPSPLSRLKNLLSVRKAVPPEEQRARALIAAIDAGGIPLNPARVNDIARSLGLETSTSSPVGETITRIRAALARRGQ
jgi:hypothetical protein